MHSADGCVLYAAALPKFSSNDHSLSVLLSSSQNVCEQKKKAVSWWIYVAVGKKEKKNTKKTNENFVFAHDGKRRKNREKKNSRKTFEFLHRKRWRKTKIGNLLASNGIVGEGEIDDERGGGENTTKTLPVSVSIFFLLSFFFGLHFSFFFCYRFPCAISVQLIVKKAISKRSSLLQASEFSCWRHSFSYWLFCLARKEFFGTFGDRKKTIVLEAMQWLKLKNKQ